MKLSHLDEKEVLVEGDASEYFEHGRRSALYPFTIGRNARQYEEVLRSEETDFTGGSYQDLHSIPSMELFKQMRKEIEQSDLRKKINTSPGTIHRRQRRLSEHDGEWDMARRWDVQPFYTAKRAPRTHRIVDIECYLSASSMVQDKVINYFGATAWAINDLLETHGISTSLSLVAESLNTDSRESRNVTVKVQVKKAGEYTDPTNIARCLTSNFYRRIIFDWFIIGCDFSGREASNGLGHPRRRPTDITFKNGKLKIMASDLEDLRGIELSKILVEILK